MSIHAMQQGILIKIFIFCAVTLLAACSLAPPYHQPAVSIPATYKEAGNWLLATPNVANLDRGAWWQQYHDPVLNMLEEKIESANQDLQAAIARYEEACATASVARADYFPKVIAAANPTREQTSNDITNPSNVPLYSDNAIATGLTYELDVWGRVRNSVAAAKGMARASAADLAAIALSLHAELANDYFSLRGDDASQRVLDETVVAYQKSFYITQQLYRGGAARESDIDLSRTQLETAKTAAADMRLKRSQLEHAIAVLIGQAPATFTILPAVPKIKIVTVAPQMPSTLLERRPDIARMEQLVIAANANIGVARAAYFPSFNLSTGIGFESGAFSNLFQRQSLVWALGPATTAFMNVGVPLATQVLFDGGKIRSLSARARAEYLETVANYRQTVLIAYQEVENNLVAIHQLDHERKTQNEASQSSKRALRQALYRYQGGLTTYVDVAIAQNYALQAELADIQVNTRRQVASVQLIKALGG